MKEFNEKTGKGLFKQHIPDTISETDNWVAQSINQAAINYYSSIFNELVLSKHINCMYLTESQFASDLLNICLTDRDIHSELANLSMQLNLPIFDNLSLDNIINVRSEGEASHNFRTAMSSRLLELRTVTDPEELKTRLENVSYELNELQVADVNKEYRKFIRFFGIDIAAFTGSLVTSFITGGLTLISGAVALIKGISDYSKYLSEVKESEGFFLWKLKRQ